MVIVDHDTVHYLHKAAFRIFFFKRSLTKNEK